MTRVLEPTPGNIKAAACALLAGDVVAVPTETVYGLAGNIFDERALARIFGVKERPVFDPLIAHVAYRSERMLDELKDCGLVDLSGFGGRSLEVLDRLLKVFWPGPFTIVLPKQKGVPDLATSGLGTVAVRMPRHHVAQELLGVCAVPLAAPSANRFGRISPTCARDVLGELGGRIGMILDGGACEIGVESTVVSMNPEGGLRLLRPGGTPREAIEKVAAVAFAAGDVAGAPQSPGMLDSHYAPRSAMFMLPAAVGKLDVIAWNALVEMSKELPRDIGLLVMSGEADASAREVSNALGRNVVARVLSPQGLAEEAARSLFRELRALDGEGAGVIFAEPCPGDTGLWHAIGDRLRRASRRMI